MTTGKKVFLRNIISIASLSNSYNGILLAGLKENTKESPLAEKYESNFIDKDKVPRTSNSKNK